jgi:hypothetical protein
MTGCTARRCLSPTRCCFFLIQVGAFDIRNLYTVQAQPSSRRTSGKESACPGGQNNRTKTATAQPTASFSICTSILKKALYSTVRAASARLTSLLPAVRSWAGACTLYLYETQKRTLPRIGIREGLTRRMVDRSLKYIPYIWSTL